MNAPHYTSFVFAALLILSAGCGSTDKREFSQALNHERNVAELFAKQLLQNAPGDGEFLVLVNPELGPRLQRSQAERIEGFKRILGESNVRAVPIASLEDPRLQRVQNDDFPAELLLEILSSHPNTRAVISLIGFPYSDRAVNTSAPLYVFGISHQGLAWQALDQGWARAVLYARGADDAPLRNPTPVAPALLASYSLEVR